MQRGVTVAIAGLGSRGKEQYAKAAKVFPEKMKIVAIADIDPEKVRQTAEEYQVPKEACFSSAEEMLEKEKLADVMFIATQDRQHVPQAIAAIKKGYHLLMEKPISPDMREWEPLLEAAGKYDRKVVVCHVLRYTPIYRKVKELLDAGEIGEVVSMMAMENVGWFHCAHSFVRGNWANDQVTSPMILQKCCHDFDLYLWLAGKHCESVSSYGSTYLFKPERAPEGAPMRCTDGCPVKDTCPFDAEAIYMDNKFCGYNKGNRNWPLNVVEPHGVTAKSIEEALRTGPYGRCVYHCDNNVVDHQIVDLNMTDGSTMSLSMCGFTADTSRYARIMGTEGEMVISLGSDEVDPTTIEIRKFAPDIPITRIDVKSLAEDFSGHAGGDIRMVEEFLDLISGAGEESPCITSLERSMESHYCAMAAEASRLSGGQPVKLDEFRDHR